MLQSEIRYTLGPLYNKKLQKNKVGTGTKTGGWEFLRMKNKVKISRDSIHLYNDYLYTLLYLVMSRLKYRRQRENDHGIFRNV